jgi:hypothetical protein
MPATSRRPGTHEVTSLLQGRSSLAFESPESDLAGDRLGTGSVAAAAVSEGGRTDRGVVGGPGPRASLVGGGVPPQLDAEERKAASRAFAALVRVAVQRMCSRKAKTQVQQIIDMWEDK